MRSLLSPIKSLFENAFSYQQAQVEAGGWFTMQMLQYRNPEAKTYDGTYCDSGSSFIRSVASPCDTYFRICLTQGDVPSSYSHGACTVLRQEYGRNQHRDQDDFSVNYRVTRPLSSFSGVRKATVLGSQISLWARQIYKGEGGRGEEERGKVERDRAA